MHRLVSWLITPIYVFIFFTIIICFHPLLFVASFFGEKVLRHFLYLMNYLLLLNVKIIAGTKFNIVRKGEVPNDRPVLVVANHQSMYDIALLMLEFRKHTPLFISKRELARGIPSISLVLRNMGAAIIDRKDSTQALYEIERLGARAAKNNELICIFPEGTRAKDGVIKPFKAKGFFKLYEILPNVAIIPVGINNSWKLSLPIPYGETVTLTIEEQIKSQNKNPSQIFTEIETKIHQTVDQPRKSSQDQ